MSELKAELSTIAESNPDIADKINSLGDKYGSLGDLVKGHVNLNSKMGTMATVPDGSDDAALGEFLQRYVPESYELEFGELESIKGEEILTDDFKGKLKELGLNNKQAQGMLELFHGLVKSKEESISQGSQSQAQQIEEAFLQKYPSAEVRQQHTGMIETYLNNQYGEEVAKALTPAIMGDVGRFSKILDIARASQSDPGLNKSNTQKTMTNIDAVKKESMSMLTGSHPQFKDALTNHRHPAHQQAVEHRQKLLNQIESLT